MVLLDTDLLVGVIRADSRALNKIRSLQYLNVPISTTSINSFELIRGACLSASKSENLVTVLDLLSSMNIHSFDLANSIEAGRLAAELEKKGETIGANDTMIAAIAILNKEVIITRNIKHFSNIKELKLEEW